MNIGTSVGPYRILSHLGSGGMGEVWLAEDTRLRRRVALKMVRAAADADPASRERLMREARAAAALNHQHIATVHDVLEEQGEVVIVFEYVEGETLHARIARERIPVAEAIDLASQIAKALAAAHAQGIIHRDLKPANVIIGVDRHVKVLDFGIARMLAVGTTQTTPAASPPSTGVFGFIGTASYAAPEQMVSSAVDERADLYALGVVLFEMISGQRPFEGSDPVQLASTKLGKDAPPLSPTGQLVPPALAHLVASLLARERHDRPENAREVVTQLRAISGEASTGSLPQAPSRSPLGAILAALLILVLGGYGVNEIRRFTAAPAPNASVPVIAVLPLTNNSGDPSKDFVAAGIAESLISSLAAVPSVTVLSRASVTEARNRIKDSAALTKDLGATFLVDGSVQQSGDILRISLNLIRADRSIAWGDSVEGTFEKIFELQSRLASALTNALVVRVSASERERMNAAPTTNPEALAAYWRGRALLERSDIKGNVGAAIAAFREALRLDNRFAMAHAGLGQAYRQNYAETRDPVWADRAIESATNALRLDPDRAEVRYVLALTLAGNGRLDEAIEELNRALALQPNYEEARRRLGLLLAEKGQLDSAIVEFRRAIALRPAAAAGYSSLGFALLQASRYTEAAAAFADMVRVAPDNFVGYQQLGAAYQFLGDHDRALENYRKAIAIRPSAPAYSNIGALLHQQGDFAGAVAAYQQAIKIRPNSAATHRNLGDALRRLDRAAEASRAYQEAVRLGEVDLEVNAQDVGNLSALAVFHAKVGNNVRARELIADALRRAPSNAAVHYRASLISVMAGDFTTGLGELKRAVDLGYSRSDIADADEFASIRNLPEFTALVTPAAKE
ncbi:MAG: tetratricopeptide repeat protein [Cyanobacteria bacterium]|nr:tetratricopeptide repeat protein [Cyanobacteriota bacterium]